VTAWARRRFLGASAAAALGTCLAPSVRRLGAASDGGERVLGTLPFLDEGAFPLETTIGAGLGERRALDLSTLTPGSLLISQERFFVRTGCPDRLPPTTTWKVRVHGLVERPVEVDLEALKREAAPMGAHLLECAGNSRAAHFGFMSAARWGGVPLERVLARVRRRPRATRVLVSGFDEHEVQDPGSVPGASWIFGLDQIREAGAFLATEMNGAPLSPDHGYPLRLVVPGWYGCTAIKWVNEIALVDDEAPATDHMREYAGRTGQDPAVPQRARDFKPASIDPAAVAVRVDELGAAAGRSTYQIVGIAWGGRAPVRHLGIRVDPNAAFAPVDEIGRGDGRTWTLWSHRLPALARGRHRIELAIAGVRTRRLDTGFYAREIEIA
jgi:DMSO/TMAO reductase YedYZ molybdopterin-dependent catalytic subunit